MHCTLVIKEMKWQKYRHPGLIHCSAVYCFMLLFVFYFVAFCIPFLEEKVNCKHQNRKFGNVNANYLEISNY